MQKKRLQSVWSGFNHADPILRILTQRHHTSSWRGGKKNDTMAHRAAVKCAAKHTRKGLGSKQSRHKALVQPTQIRLTSKSFIIFFVTSVSRDTCNAHCKKDACKTRRESVISHYLLWSWFLRGIPRAYFSSLELFAPLSVKKEKKKKILERAGT